MKLASWNINGLRAVMKKGELVSFVTDQLPDVICLQEVKIKPEQVDFEIPNYKLVLNSAERPGYSGTGMLIRSELAEKIDLEAAIRRNFPADLVDKYQLGVDQFGNPNAEGRIIVLEMPDYFIATVYTPNGKSDLSRIKLRHQQWDPAFLEYMKRLGESKPVIFCGDLNVAATEIDLANPKQNVGKHGFTDEERDGFVNYLANGFVDSFRLIHGNIPEQYTWWSHWARARERNIGWRIDYFLVDERLKSRIQAADIMPNQLGSDHCPISLVLE